MADIFELFKQIAKKDETKAVPVSWIIVGLGNPGPEYRNTRHNAGFLTVEELARQTNIKIDRARFHALTGEGMLGEHKVLLVKPQTMMNASGVAVAEAARFYKIAPEHIVVISDDINLAPGQIRIRQKGSAGGQKGLKSIIEQLGSENFPRVRMGVGAKPHPDYDLADWVLSDFPKKEMEQFEDAAACAADGIRLLLDGKLDAAMMLCNSHKPRVSDEAK